MNALRAEHTDTFKTVFPAQTSADYHNTCLFEGWGGSAWVDHSSETSPQLTGRRSRNVGPAPGEGQSVARLNCTR